MRTIAVTGGVACGKGASRQLLSEVAGARGITLKQFDCDQSVAGLLNEPEVQNELEILAGGLSLDDSGKLDKHWLREKLFADKEFRIKVESFLHPLVFDRVQEYVRSESTGADAILVEVPLLYEVDFPMERELTIVVAASRRTQVDRLVSKRNLDENTARLILDSQMPIQSKIDKGDLVVWNDGDLGALRAQIGAVAERIIF